MSDDSATRFKGTLDDGTTEDMAVSIEGKLRWIDGHSTGRRVSGEITAVRGTMQDPFRRWAVGSLRGRVARLSIPGIGLSPVRIHSDGKIQEDGTTPIAFEAWSPPVPIATKPELAEVLRAPIADALEQAGLSDLADMARAAAVALDGFTPPPPRGSRAK